MSIFVTWIFAKGQEDWNDKSDTKNNNNNNNSEAILSVSNDELGSSLIKSLETAVPNENHESDRDTNHNETNNTKQKTVQINLGSIPKNNKRKSSLPTKQK